MAENKNALANETANETGNAAITERLDDVAERMAEAEKATAAVAEEQKQRLAEQEQNSEQLQKAEEERRAQAAENAKSVADRRAAVLDYTENYRQNQKIEKAARATVSKAKMERLAAEAEAKAKAEREAEEALQREREELMARRRRSSELLKKVDNDSETKASEAKAPAAAPAKEAMPKAAPAPAAAPVATPASEEAPAPAGAPVATSAPAEAPASENAPAETAAIAAASVAAAAVVAGHAASEKPSEAPAEAPEAAAPEADVPAEQISAPDGTPDIPDVNLPENASAQAPAADDAASAEESAPVAEVDADPTIDTDNNINEALTQLVDGDLERAMEDVQAQQAREAEVAEKVDEDLLKTRVAQLMPARLIPESLRLYKTTDKDKYDRKAKLRSPARVPDLSEFDGAFRRLEDAVSAAERNSEARLAAALGRVGYMTDRAQETADRLGQGDAAPTVMRAVNVGSPSRMPSNAAIAAAAVGSGTVGDEALPEAYDSKEFESPAELKTYLKKIKKDIKAKKREVAQTTREPDESKQDFERRRMERQASLLGLQLGNIALLCRKGYVDEAEKFMGDAEDSVDECNRRVEKYNRLSGEDIQPVPENTVSQVAKTGRLPELPFGSAAAGLDASLRGGAYEADETAENSTLEKQKALKKEQKALRKEQKALYEEEQKAMLEHAMEWNPQAASEIKEKVDEYTTEKKKRKEERKAAKAAKAAQSDETSKQQEPKEALHRAHSLAMEAEREGRPADKQGRSSEELYEAYKKAAEDEKNGREPEGGQSSDELYALYLATVAEEKQKRSGNDGAESRDNHRVSNALHSAMVSAQKDASENSEEEGNDYISSALGAAYAESLEYEKQSSEAKGKKKSQALEAAYRAAKDEEDRAAKKGEKSRPSEVLRAAFVASDKVERKNGTANDEGSVSRSLKAAYLAAEEKEEDENASTADVLEAAYIAARSEEKQEASEEESSASGMLWAAYVKASEKDKKSDSEEDSDSQKKSSGKKKSDSDEEDEEDEDKKSDAPYASYLATLAEEKQVKNSRDASDEDDEEDEDDEDTFDGDWDSWEENYAEDMPGTAQTIRETYHREEPERKKQLEELQHRFLYEQLHADDSDKNFPVEDIYKARDEQKKAEVAAERVEENFASKEAIADIQKQKDEYAAQVRREEWLPDAKESENTIRSIAEENRKQQILTARLVKAQEESIRAAAEEAKTKTNLTLDRIAKDYEAQIRACAEAERETRLFAEAQASEKERAAAEAERLAEKAYRDAEHQEKLYYAKLYAAEKEVDEALEAAARRAELLAAEADRTEENLEKLRLAKEASEKSKALSLERKTEMLTLAMEAVSEMEDAKAEKRMRKQVALLAKKEAKAAEKAEKRDRKRLLQFESDLASVEADARATEQEVERLENAMILLHGENADQEALQDAYNEILRENSKASEARRAAMAAKEKLEAEKALAAQKQEAKDAMLAFAAAMGAKKVGGKKVSSARQKSRYLTVAIANAERSYDRALLAVANADDRALQLKETNAPEREIELLNQARAKLSLKVVYAEEKLKALRATKEVLDTSTVMSKREKADLLSMAIAVADNEDHKAVERLNKRVAVFAKKEAAAARRADRALALNINRWDKHVAAEEAKARVSEKSARSARAKADRLALENAEKRYLSEAYEQALLEEALAKDARKSADEAKEKRDAKRERADSHKEANAALLAFAGAYAATEKRKTKDSKKKQELSEEDQQKLDSAISRAERNYEKAVRADDASEEQSKALVLASKEERKAAKEAKRYSEQSRVQAEDHLDTLQATKNAVKKSHVLSREEKAEMIALVTEEKKNDKKRKKAIKKLKKKIAEAAKKEARAAKVVAREEKYYALHREKTAADAEAHALLSESKAMAAKAKADHLFAKKSNAKTLQKAYNHALIEQDKAERARIAFEGAQERVTAGRELVAEHEDAREAMLALAAAIALEEKNRKAKRTKSKSAAPMKSSRKLDAAILRATDRYERAEKSFNALRESLLRATERRTKDSELQEIYSRFARFEAEKASAKNELETLNCAKAAVQKTKALTPAQKNELLTLLLRAKEEKRQKSEAANRLKKKINLAAKREEMEARRASKKNDRKAKRIEKAYLAKAAKALVAEEIAQKSKQQAVYLTSQKANKKTVYKAYRKALLEQTKAENAKRTAEQLQAKLAVVNERTEVHKDAKMALLEFGAAFAVEEKAKSKKDRRRKTGVDLKAAYLDAAIAEAERSYEEALANSTASKLSARVLDEKRVPSKQLAQAYKEALLAEDKANLARDRIQSLRAARAVAEKSTRLSIEDKEDMLALIEEENTRRAQIKKAEKLKKYSRAINEQIFRTKTDKGWKESVARYEADALVKEDAATVLAKKLEQIRVEDANRRALEKAYKQALIEESQAKKARKKAEIARVESKLDEIKKEKAAAWALEKKRKSEKDASRSVKRTTVDADMYASACEAKSELSTKKALLLASKPGKKNEKLKAYELALLDRYTAVQAREEAEKMKSEGVSEKTVAENRKERKLREEIEKNARVYDKALEKLQEKQDRIAARRAKKNAKAIENGEISEEGAQEAGKTKLEKKLEKEVIAREKKQSEIEEKIRKADEKAQERAEAAKNNPRLAAKLRYEALQAERKRIADEKAWELMIKKDEAQDRHDSYMRALYQEKKDLERIAAKADATVETPITASALDAKPAISAILGRREKVRRFKAFRKLDLEVLRDRYDYEIAEILRELELTLADFTCTPTLRRRAEYEAKRKVAMLKKRKRDALRQQKADNRRYMACLRARYFKAKNHHTDPKELVKLRNRFFELLEQKNAENERLQSLCCPDSYRGAKKVATPWHKAFLKEKKRWQKRCRKQFELIEELHLSRTEKQKLRAELDRYATSHADIAEAKVRARKMKLRGMAKLRYKQELVEIKQEVRRARRHMKQKFKAAMARSNHRNFWVVSLLYLAITIIIVIDAAVIWWILGEDITRFLTERFPGIMSRLK